MSLSWTVLFLLQTTPQDRPVYLPLVSVTLQPAFATTLERQFCCQRPPCIVSSCQDITLRAYNMDDYEAWTTAIAKVIAQCQGVIFAPYFVPGSPPAPTWSHCYIRRAAGGVSLLWFEAAQGASLLNRQGGNISAQGIFLGPMTYLPHTGAPETVGVMSPFLSPWGPRDGRDYVATSGWGCGLTIHKLSGSLSWGIRIRIHNFQGPLELGIWTHSPQISVATSDFVPALVGMTLFIRNMTRHWC